MQIKKQHKSQMAAVQYKNRPLAAGLEVVESNMKESAKSIKKHQHWRDGLQIEPLDFETRG